MAGTGCKTAASGRNLLAWALACLWAAAAALVALPAVAQRPAAAMATADVEGPPAVAETPDATAASGTGDAWSDRQLDDIDVYAARYRDAFVDELVRYFDAPRAFVDDQLDDPKWRAGDLYYACAVARAAGRPCRAVAALRARQRALPWEAIAEQIGVAPGSVQAGRIRAAFGESYARWARPLLPATVPADATPTQPPAPASARRAAPTDAPAGRGR